MSVGQICAGTVTQVNDLGAVCDLDNGVKAIALKDNLEGENTVYCCFMIQLIFCCLTATVNS